MTIINIFRLIFGTSKRNSQDLTLQSNLDIANAQPASEEYVGAEEEPLPAIEELTTADDTDVPAVNEQELVHETIDDLQDFVNEIDKEYSTVQTKPEDSNIEDIEAEVVEQEVAHETTSLLDNSPYMSLADSCCDLIKELDKLKSEDNQELIDLVNSRIKEGLISSGAEPIAEETSYDVIRHTAVGKSIVRKGTPISSTIEPGVVIDDRVMIKAKVQI